MSAVIPAGYAWEPTDEQITERYGVPPERVARFDLNTSPAPPEPALRALATGRFDRPISEYPPSDYRHLVDAAAAAYGVPSDEILVGAGADEVLDLAARAFLPPGGTAVVPVPTYAMYRILAEQRPARAVEVPRRGRADGYALDLPAVRAAARGSDLVWLCSPNNPTGLPEPAGAVAALLADLAADANDGGLPAPAVVLDEAYAEFAGTSLVDLRAAYPRLVVVRTASKAYALAGLRVGFGIARRETLAVMGPYRPPGSVSVVSAAVAAAVLRDATWPAANVTRIAAERERLAAGLRDLGWAVGPSVTNFLLVDFGSPSRARAVADGLLRRGLVPRTFGPDHLLADHLRITVRSRGDDDRLLDAARALAAQEAPR